MRGLFAVEPRRELSPGGNAEATQIYLVTRANPRAFFLGSRGVEGIETRMIGRDAELARLQEAFQTAIEDSELQVVTIVGEAGVGKARLLHAFRSWEELQAQQAWLFAGRALPELASQPFALLRDVFAFRFAIQDSDSPTVARDKLERGITSGLGAGDPDAVMKAHLQGNNAQARALQEQSLALFRELGDKQGIGRVLIRLGVVASDQGTMRRRASCTSRAWPSIARWGTSGASHARSITWGLWRICRGIMPRRGRCRRRAWHSSVNWGISRRSVMPSLIWGLWHTSRGTVPRRGRCRRRARRCIAR